MRADGTRIQEGQDNENRDYECRRSKEHASSRRESNLQHISKCELQRHLHQSGRGRSHHMTEQIIVYAAVYGRGAEELCMIERVERLHTELQQLRFRQPDVLQQSDVE